MVPRRCHWLALLLSLLACALAPAAASASGCDRYAAPFGSDTAAGSQSFPYKTAQKLGDSLTPGQTGCLNSGTYAEEIDGPYVLRMGHGGAPGAPITIRSTPGQRATLRGIVYVVEHSDNVILSDLSFDARRPTQDKSSGIQIMAADTTIQDSDITNHAYAICMALGSPGWGVAVRTVLQRNVFHDCGWRNDNKEHSVYVDLTESVVIKDNLFVRSGAYAVHLYPEAHNTTVTHNVFVDNGGGVIFAGEAGAASSGNTVAQNIITGSWMRPGIHSGWGAVVGQNNLADSNCLFDNPKGHVDVSGGGFAAKANIIADPGFVNEGTGDYRLTGSSACLGKVGYDTVAKIHGDPQPTPEEPSPTPTPATTPKPTATPATTPKPTTTTPKPTATPSTPKPKPTATPEATVPPATDGTQPEIDPNQPVDEAARVVVDDEAFSASGGSPRPCKPRKRCR